MKLSSLLFSLTLFQGAFLASAAPITYVDQAADFVITTDNGAAGVLDAGDVVTWQPTTGPDVTGLVFETTAFTSIQAAVDAVDVDGTVRIAAGTYAEGAEILVSKALTIEGEGPELTILSGGGDGDVNTVNPSAHRVMSFSISTTIRNLAIVNGEYQGTTEGGGGVYYGSAFSSITLENCKFSGNVSKTDGGTVHFSRGLLVITECTFDGNTALGDGGGVYSRDATLELRRSTFHNNVAFGNGGGVYLEDYVGDFTFMRNCTLSGNHASGSGGGAYWDRINAGRVLAIEYATVTGNTAGVSAGGIWIRDREYLSNQYRGVIGTIVIGNDAPIIPNIFERFVLRLMIEDLDLLNLDTPDQLLEPLADNGGPTLTHNLLAVGSDNVESIVLRDRSTLGMGDVDQRGLERPFGDWRLDVLSDALDHGAVEYTGLRIRSSSPVNGETVDSPPANISIKLNAGDYIRTISNSGLDVGWDFDPTSMTWSNLSQVVLRRQSNDELIPVTVTGSGATLTITPDAALPVDDYSVEVNGLIATHTLSGETLGPLASSFLTFRIQTAPEVYVGASEDFTEDGGTLTFQAGTANEVTGLVLGHSAFTDVQSAVDHVHTGGTVHIGPGVYHQGAQILVTRSMNLVGSGADQTTLSGGDSHRVFLIRNDAEVVISDLTITEGMVDGGVYFGDGAGIYASGCSLTLDRVIVSESEAARVGGGIFMKRGELSIQDSLIESNRSGFDSVTFSHAGGVYVDESTVSFTNTTLTGNETAGEGGAIYIRSGTITYTNSTLVGNQADAGGGIYNNGTLTLNNSTLTANQADVGGGVYVNSGTLNCTNSIVAGNTATTSDPNLFGTITAGSNNLTSGDPMLGPLADNGASTGTMLPLPGSPAIEGGIDTGSLPATDQRGFPRLLGATVDIGAVETESLIVSSAADSGLGSLRRIVADAAPGDIITFADFMAGETILLTSGEITVDKDLTIDSSSLPGGITFDGNDNGRIFAFSSGTFVFENVTLMNGRASGASPDNKGGAIYLDNTADLTLTNSTLSGHSADQGGAIYLNDGTLTLLNSTISANEADIGGGIYRNSGTLNTTNSIVAGNTATTSNSNLFGTITAGSNNLTSGDPMLGPLADNGGPTWTMLPLPGSPAIDGGIDTGSLPSTDQRGFTRVLGAVVDIGSVEPKSLIVSSLLDSGPGSLRQIITDASTGDTITFAGALSGQTISLTNGQFTMVKNLTIDASALAGGITLDGNANGRIFEFTPGTTSALTGFTLTNGGVSGVSPDSQGGAIFISETANLTLTDMVLSNHTAAAQGGAIYNDGNLTINSSTLSNNTASSSGGAIYNDGNLTIKGSALSNNTTSSSGGAIYNDGNLTIKGSTLSNNTTSSSGGAIYNDINSTLTINDSTLSDNSAPSGAGGAILNLSRNILMISNTTLSDNDAGSAGGAIYTGNSDVDTPVAMVISNSSLLRNSANSEGGAIYIFFGGDAYHTLEYSTVSNNTAEYGGGIYNGDDLRINSSTLSGNVADTNGGGIYNEEGDLTLNSSTLSNNTANSSGGGIFNDGSFTVNNSTLAINQADNGGGIYNDRSLTVNNSTLSLNEATDTGGGIFNVRFFGSLTLDNSIVADNTADTSDNIEGSINAGDDNITSGDPMLSPLGDYGGPTRTMPPLADSPAIDNGNNSIVEGVFPYDQRGPGFNRISGGWVDIGACELRQQTPLLDWRILHGLDPDGDDDFANPSGDGISNILKYAFNLAPFAGDLQTSNTRVVSPDGISGLPLIGATEEGLLFITFVRRKASSFPEISYEPSSGSDLGNFAPLSLDSATVTSIDDEWERVTVVDPVASDTRFGRIGVTN